MNPPIDPAPKQTRRFLEGMRKSANLPHASKQLNDTTIAKGKGHSDIGDGDATGLQVDSRQDESGQGEGAQAEGSRIGELAPLNGLVQTRLELTTEGGKASVLAGVSVDVGVAAIVVGTGYRLVATVDAL